MLVLDIFQCNFPSKLVNFCILATMATQPGAVYIPIFHELSIGTHMVGVHCTPAEMETCFSKKDIYTRLTKSTFFFMILAHLGLQITAYGVFNKSKNVKNHNFGFFL